MRTNADTHPVHTFLFWDTHPVHKNTNWDTQDTLFYFFGIRTSRKTGTRGTAHGTRGTTQGTRGTALGTRGTAQGTKGTAKSSHPHVVNMGVCWVLVLAERSGALAAPQRDVSVCPDPPPTNTHSPKHTHTHTHTERAYCPPGSRPGSLVIQVSS